MCMVEAGSRVEHIPVLLMIVMIVLDIHVVKAIVLEIVLMRYLLPAILRVVVHMDLVDHILVAQVIIVAVAMVDIVEAIAAETVAENVAAYVRTDAALETEVKENLWKLSLMQTNDYLQLWGARIISHQQNTEKYITFAKLFRMGGAFIPHPYPAAYFFVGIRVSGTG